MLQPYHGLGLRMVPGLLCAYVLLSAYFSSASRPDQSLEGNYSSVDFRADQSNLIWSGGCRLGQADQENSQKSDVIYPHFVNVTSVSIY